MKYYIVDDEIGIVKVLANIIESRKLGEVVGYETSPEEAIKEMATCKPNIVLVDLLMSKMDGITLVSRMKEIRNDIAFVMISKVEDRGMIEQAYNAGIEFFIRKPINVIEVERVLSNLSEKIELGSIVNSIRGMFGEERNGNDGDSEDKTLADINILMGQIGMLGERGVGDIKDICRYLIKNNLDYNKNVLNRIAENKNELPKNVEQRIRRAIKKGLTNVANIGIEDFGNEILQVYASYVFDYKNIKDEMEYIKGKNDVPGRVNISKFIEGLLLFRKNS